MLRKYNCVSQIISNRIKNPENNTVVSKLGFLEISLSCREALADDRAMMIKAHINQLTLPKGKRCSKFNV